MEQRDSPLRAIILDNDETTGSYIIIYTILTGLAQCKDVTEEAILIILQRLATWMITHHVFRPGIRAVFRTILELKRHKAIDVVIMYTNQTGHYDFTTLDGIKTRVCVPYCISYMLSWLCDSYPLFDKILMREEDAKRNAQGRHPKSFSRILNLYPEKPRDIRQMIFVDDLAEPTFIHAQDIPSSQQHNDSWYPIDPYYRRLSPTELRDCFETCFADTFVLQDQILIEQMTTYYYQYAPERSSAPNANPFLNLCSQLIRRYPLPA